MVKERITLSWDEDVLRKARQTGENLSELTQQFMKAYNSALRPDDDLKKNYQNFFDSILPLMKNYDFNLKIAETLDYIETTDDEGTEYNFEMPLNIFLEADGSFYIGEYDKRVTMENLDTRDFIAPKKILQNLVNTLSKTEELMNEKKNEIMMAKRIVDAICKTVIKKPSKMRFLKKTEI